MIAMEALASIYERNEFDGEPSEEAKKPYRYRARKYADFSLQALYPSATWGIYDELSRRFLTDAELCGISVDEMMPEGVP